MLLCWVAASTLRLLQSEKIEIVFKDWAAKKFPSKFKQTIKSFLKQTHFSRVSLR